MPPSAHSDGSQRRRTTRACDQCRRTKSRCEHPSQSQEPCRNCLLSGTDCTFLEPSHKRGPPKGYLSALEQRLHDAEALLGVIISSPDSRATSMVADLSKDTLAASIIARVANSGFGPLGRSALRHHDTNFHSRRRSTDLRQQQMHENEAPLIDGNGHLVFTTPSNMWQDYLNLRLSLESGFRAQVSSKLSLPNASSEQPQELSFKSLHSAPKPPALNPSFQFPISLTADMVDTVPVKSDTSTVDSPASISSGPMAMCHGTPEGDDSDDAASLSTNQSQVTLTGDLNGHADGRKDFAPAPYNVACSLVLDHSFSSFPCPQFNAHQVQEPPLDALKSRTVKYPWAKQQVDTDTWTELVDDATEPPPSLFGDAMK